MSSRIWHLDCDTLIPSQTPELWHTHIDSEQTPELRHTHTDSESDTWLWHTHTYFRVRHLDRDTSTLIHESDIWIVTHAHWFRIRHLDCDALTFIHESGNWIVIHRHFVSPMLEQKPLANAVFPAVFWKQWISLPYDFRHIQSSCGKNSPPQTIDHYKWFQILTIPQLAIPHSSLHSFCTPVCVRARARVCVCVCVREREREGGGRERGRERETTDRQTDRQTECACTCAGVVAMNLDNIMTM